MEVRSPARTAEEDACGRGSVSPPLGRSTNDESIACRRASSAIRLSLRSDGTSGGRLCARNAHQPPPANKGENNRNRKNILRLLRLFKWSNMRIQKIPRKDTTFFLYTQVSAHNYYIFRYLGAKSQSPNLFSLQALPMCGRDGEICFSIKRRQKDGKRTAKRRTKKEGTSYQQEGIKTAARRKDSSGSRFIGYLLPLTLCVVHAGCTLPRRG